MTEEYQKEEKITTVDVEEFPIAILVVSQDNPYVWIHTALYPSSPNEKDLISLKKEVMENVEEIGYEGPEEKLQYIEISTEEFMKMIGGKEVDDG